MFCCLLLNFDAPIEEKLPFPLLKRSSITSAFKEMAEKKQKENMQNGNTMTNGVVITVYVESLRTRSSKLSEDPIKKTKPHPRFKMSHAAGTRGYDRRAQLLAYSRQLRNEGSKKVQKPSNQSLPRTKSKEKRLWLAQPVRICSPSTQMLPSSSARSRHERVESKECKEINRSKKRKGSGNTCYPFLRKLKSMLKKLSCKED